MPRIIELSRHVSDLIAAGEVVERPASAVKELLENSIDAGATAITVEIKNGGMSFIRVTDNGSGILKEDAKTAFLRHATSKIHNEEDLSGVKTLGFRGEALAAIAAVSKIELLTLADGEQTGTALTLEGGVIVSETDAGCPKGTTIIVRDLFYNTPARQKFLKRDLTEASHILSCVQRAALSHPEVSIKYIKDGKIELHTPGDSQLMSCIYCVYGRAFALGLAEVCTDYEGIYVSGFVTKPAFSRANRAMQHFFVNGRPVRSRTLFASLEEAFKNSLTTGRFPGCVLHVTVNAETVDVNVHPAKAEVKFSNDRRVFDAVYFATKNALESDTGRVSLDTAYTRRPFSPFQAEAGKQENIKESFARPEGFKTKIPPVPDQSLNLPLHDNDWILKYEKPAQMQNAEGVSFKDGERQPADFRIIGEALGTYIIVEQDQNLIFIDKHAAHERIIFERLRASDMRPSSQLLLQPLLPALSAQESGVLIENLGLLNDLGFEAEDFGGGSLSVRACPGDIDEEDITATLSEFALQLLESRRDLSYGKRDLLLYTIACKAAIKAGSRQSYNETQALVREVLSNPEIKFCPHGRPIVFEITDAQLKRQFKRI